MKKLLMLCTICSLAAVGTAGAETVHLCGSSTVTKKVISKIQEPFKQATGIELAVNPNGSGNGAKDLLAGSCDASMASESLKELQQTVPGLAAPDVKGHVVAEDEIKVFVNKANAVSKLTREQVKGLHTGKIKNWKEVGGADADVVVVTSHKGSGNRSAFMTIAMDGEPYSADAVETATDVAELKEVATMKEAISAIGEAFINDTIKVVETPKIARKLLIITKGEPKSGVTKLLTFIESDGKKHIK
ncbi:MAG: phosphate ABC transporter substrate-binding protein [Desulfuromonadales bacterium]|nr:MAG: phosphate ABC transporter substrate-binding protein [Desulfuromonadales bacterium]